MPDFNFHAWPQAHIEDYDKVVNLIISAGKMQYETNKAGWIGNLNTNFRRKKLSEIGKKNDSILDILDMSWKPSKDVKLNYTKYMSLDKLVQKYSILIDIEGNGYSARLKFLLWSNRPLLLIDRPHKEYFFEFLKPWEHYIPVDREMTDLVEKTKWCMDNYEKACEIAKNAFEFSKKYLTRDYCYEQ